MFDEKYHDRTDEFAMRMERLGNQMNPSPRLMQAAKDGIPLRKTVNQYTPSYHVKKFAKAAIVYAMCICLFLGLALLLPNWMESTPPVGGNEGKPSLSVSHSIPDGWEAVSVQGNLTHIRMKEGADAYRWVDQSTTQEGGHFAIDVEAPDHFPAWQQTVTVTLYYGCFYMDDDGPYLFTQQQDADLFRPLALYMTGYGNDQLFLQINSPEELPPVSFRDDVYSYDVGLTQGIMITLPLSAFEGDGVKWELDSEAVKYYFCYGSHRLPITYTQWGFRYFRSRSVLQEYLESTFPYLLFVGNSPLLVLPTAVIGSIILLIRALKRKKYPISAFIPPAFGVVHTVTYYLVWEAFYENGGFLDGLAEGFYLMFGNAIYCGMAMLMACFCLALGLRRSHQKAKQKRETKQSDTPKSKD